MSTAWQESPSGLLIPVGTSLPTGLDLFCGAGGFSLGVEAAGIDVVAAAEMDPAATATYLHNLGSRGGCAVAYDSPERRDRFLRGLKRYKLSGGWIGAARGVEADSVGCRGFYHGDIAGLTGQAMLELAQVARIDVVFGGPPCQGLSPANSKACIEDPRNGCLWEFMRIVTELGPRMFVVENVPQLLTAGKGGLYMALRDMALDAGYDVVANVLNAADYGVPQHRRRAFVVGTLDGAAVPWSMPMPTHWAVGATTDGRAWDMRQRAKYDLSSVTDETDPNQPNLFEEGA